mgnify:CR=1 FL=1
MLPIDERLQQGEGCQCPLLRRRLGRAHLQGLAETRNCRVNVSWLRGAYPVASVVRDADVVLRLSPFEGHCPLRAHGQGAVKAGDRRGYIGSRIVGGCATACYAAMRMQMTRIVTHKHAFHNALRD